MKIDIITIFPTMFSGVFSESMLKIAQDKEKCCIELHDLRKWTKDRHHKVDDKPYGGGGGMIMKIEPLEKAVNDIKKGGKDPEVVLLSPKGRKFGQAIAVEYSKKDHVVLLCGHYGGVDNRVRSFVDAEVSIGDYILTCGEIPAMVFTDAVVRLLPGVLGNERSLQEESFDNDLLEAPKYTRPENYKGLKVPSVLLSGDHAEIIEWKKKKRLEITRERRPDILKKR